MSNDAETPGTPKSPAPALVDELNALPPGTRFGELEIVRTLGVGGFGIVYLARDHSLEREIAIKEYMPGQLAQRGEGSMVSVRSGSLVETFELGRRSFVNEARLLARFDHPSLLKVYRFWEAHGTAYMAMPYLQGKTLKQARQAMAERPTEAWMLKVLLPVISGLSLLHGESVYHRDIAPDNILLPEDGDDPILLDFGAARRAIGDQTQTFTAILKPSYAPIEQYAEATALRQGPWTDVYALGAVMHYLVLGRTPPPSTARSVADEYQPLATLDLPGFSQAFLAAIDWSLGVRPQERPQSMAELRGALLGEIGSPQPAPPPAPRVVRDEERTVMMAREEHTYQPTQLLPKKAGEATAAPPPPDVALPPLPMPPTQPADVPARAPSSPPVPAASGFPLKWVLLAAGLLLLVAGGWFMRGGKAPAPAAPAEQPVVSTAPPPVPPASQPEVAAALPAAVPQPVPTPQAALPDKTVATPPQATASPPRAALAAATPRPAASRPDARPPRADVAKPVAASPSNADALAAAQRAVPRTPPVAERPVAAPPEPAKPGTPREACGKRVFIAMAMCIARECEKPEFTANEECVRLREIKERRENLH